MPVAVSPAMAGADFLCCLGLGLAVAALYDAARFVGGNSKAVCFALDLLFFALAGVLVCSFAAWRSWAGVVRWYHMAGLAGGHLAYNLALAPATWRVKQGVYALLALPFRLVYRGLLRPIGRAAAKLWGKATAHKGKMHKKRRQQHTKQLQNQAKVLYNSN